LVKQATLASNNNQASTNQNAILTTQNQQTNKINTTIPPTTPYADLTNNNNNNNNNLNANNNANLPEANSEKVAKSLGQTNDLQRRSRFNNEETKSAKNVETTNSLKVAGNVYQQMSTVPSSANNKLNPGVNNNAKLVNQQVPQQQQQQQPQVTSAAAAIAAAAAQVANSASIPAGVTSTNNSYHMSLQQAQTRAGSGLQQKQQQGKLKILNGKAKEDSQASISCNSESNKNSRQFMLTPQHQPIIKNQKQQSGLNNSASGVQSFPSATPTTTAGIAYMQNNNNKSMVGNGGGSSQIFAGY